MAVIKKVQAKKYGKPYQVNWSWYDDDGNRHFKKERFRTEREAKAKKRQVEADVADANLPDYNAGKETFIRFANDWHTEKSIETKPSTANSYRAILDTSVLPVFGTQKVGKITTADVQAFIVGLAERKLTPPTIKHHVNVVRWVLSYAVRAKAIRVNPALDAALPTDKTTGRAKPEPVFLEGHEVERLAQVLDSTPPYGLMVRFAAFTGLRAGEIAGLNISDVDPLRSRVTVRRTRRKVKGGWETHVPKNGKTRRVPMPEWLRDDVIAFIDQHPHRDKTDAPLWPGRVNGDVQRFTGGKGSLTYEAPWERGAFYKRQFKPALAAAGLPERTRLHDLRHTYASICASEEIPLWRVAEYLGHANEGITKAIYTHLFDTDASEDMRKLARPVASKPSESNVTPLPKRRSAG